MKNNAIPNEKKLVLVIKAFDHNGTSGINLRTSPSFWIMAVSIVGKTSK